MEDVEGGGQLGAKIAKLKDGQSSEFKPEVAIWQQLGIGVLNHPNQLLR